jgi:glucans biosynthesis protein
MHGGAKGSGAPQGNRNALKAGLYTAEQRATRRQVGLIMRTGKKLLRDI